MDTTAVAMDTSAVDEIIQGRVEPSIYAFSTNTVPNYLKVGDTYRPVSIRLKEWAKYFQNLSKQFDAIAKVDAQTYFRDYSVHSYLEQVLKKHRLEKHELSSEDIFFSKEFFRAVTPENIQEAIDDIKKDFEQKSGKYVFYDALDSMPVHVQLASKGFWTPRPNQAAVIEAFEHAVQCGRHNLLMYAVMRFGKSFTALCCAQKIHARLIVVVSGKADVAGEWRKNVECADNFRNDYDFMSAEDIERNYQIVSSQIADKNQKGIVLFLTLQDLQGDRVKPKHEQIFAQKIDLLIVDETHFGARAESYGKILKNTQIAGESRHKYDGDDYVEVKEAEKQIKAFDAKVVLHLSGTPYRILMGSEFKPEDIIAFCQFADIVREKEKWDSEHLTDEDVPEWDNPYFGFPQMIRFAFHPDEQSQQRLKELQKSGQTFALSALLQPVSIRKSADGSHLKFKYESEVFNLLKVIDGSRQDKNILGFLDYPKIKAGQMCHHMVFVLPYCASCDAMEQLLKTHAAEFKNIQEYQILNISGIDRPNAYKTPHAIQEAIRDFEKAGKKTITLTVNRMLTGSTVPEWDTMLFLKDTASPQEYDQAIFRLQNQYTVCRASSQNPDKTIKLNRKPQTLLVDFDPMRMFRMLEAKAQIYNVNVDEAGNLKLQSRIEEELRISPVIVFNAEHNKLEQIRPIDIMNAVSEYSNNRGVMEETLDIPIDGALFSNPTVWAVIQNENELGSKHGFEVSPAAGPGGTLETPGGTVTPPPPRSGTPPAEEPPNESENYQSKEKRFRMYYTRILYYAYLTKDTVISLEMLLDTCHTEENHRIFTNLNLSEAVLREFLKMDKFVLRELDYAIQHLNQLAHDSAKTPLERAEIADRKFGKLGQSQIVTPAFIADEMVAGLPEDFLKGSVANQWAILDIASKKGEFAIALCKRFRQLGFEPSQYRNLLYAIPTSSICYEFTRKVYEILGLNIQMIAAKFNSYDLLTVKDNRGKIDYEKIQMLLSQSKAFDTIAMNDDVSQTTGKSKKMKFETVISNPPYQEMGGGFGVASMPLYDKFVSIGKIVAGKFVSMIIPAKWFAGGRYLDDFRCEMLQDRSLKEIHDYENGKRVFSSVDIPGGVCYFLREKEFSGQCEIINTLTDGTRISNSRTLNEFDTFIRSNEGVEIVKKIKSKNEKYLSDRVSFSKPFGLRTFYQSKGNGIPCWFIQKAGLGFAKKEDVQDSYNYLKKWKLLIPPAPIAGQTDFSKPVGFYYDGNVRIAKPGECCTESWLVAGAFDTEEETLAFKSYIFTKVVRFLLLQSVVSQHVTRKNFCFVPDLGTYSGCYTDRQLCEKWGITEEEWQYIDSRISSSEALN